MLVVADEERAGRPRPGDDRAERAVLGTDLEHLPERGTQPQRRGLEVVGQGGAELELVSDAVGHIEIEGDLLGTYDGDQVEATMLFDGYEVTVAGERTDQDEIAGTCEFAGDTADVTLWR